MNAAALAAAVSVSVAALQVAADGTAAGVLPRVPAAEGRHDTQLLVIPFPLSFSSSFYCFGFCLHEHERRMRCRCLWEGDGGGYGWSFLFCVHGLFIPIYFLSSFAKKTGLGREDGFFFPFVLSHFLSVAMTLLCS